MYSNKALAWQRCGCRFSKCSCKHFIEKEAKIQYFGAASVRQSLSGAPIKMPVLYLTKLTYNISQWGEKFHCKCYPLQFCFWAISKRGNVPDIRLKILIEVFAGSKGYRLFGVVSRLQVKKQGVRENVCKWIIGVTWEPVYFSICYHWSLLWKKTPISDSKMKPGLYNTSYGRQWCKESQNYTLTLDGVIKPSCEITNTWTSKTSFQYFTFHLAHLLSQCTFTVNY